MSNPCALMSGLCYNFLKGGAVMGRHSDYSIKEDKEKISFEEAYAKLGKDVMTPSDYVPLVEKYLGLPVDEKTIRKRVQEICNRSQGLLSVRDFKSGSKNSYRFDPSYNELLLALLATECFDKRKNDSRVSTRAAIYNQLLQNIVKVSLQRHNHKSQQKPSQPTLKRRCFFVKSDVFLWPGFRKEWC